MTEKETVINREGNCNFISPEKDQRIEKDWRRKLCHPKLQYPAVVGLATLRAFFGGILEYKAQYSVHSEMQIAFYYKI